MRDEELTSVDPVEMVGYVYAEMGGTPEKRPYN